MIHNPWEELECNGPRCPHETSKKHYIISEKEIEKVTLEYEGKVEKAFIEGKKQGIEKWASGYEEEIKQKAFEKGFEFGTEKNIEKIRQQARTEALEEAVKVVESCTVEEEFSGHWQSGFSMAKEKIKEAITSLIHKNNV